MHNRTSNKKSNPINKALDIIGLILIILFLVITIIVWKNAPSIIPTHYNFAGVADAYGSKNTMLYFTVPITLVLYIGLFLVSKHPEIHNFPINITDENKESLYNLSTRLVKIINIELILIFLFINTSTRRPTLSASFLPIIMIVMFTTLGIFIYKMMKIK